MDKILGLSSVSCCLAAGVGLTLIDRSLLLTDTYKFPYPLAVTLLQLFFTACLALLFTLILKPFLPRPSFAAYDLLFHDKEGLATAHTYDAWHSDHSSLASRRSSESSQHVVEETYGLLNSASPSVYRLVTRWTKPLQRRYSNSACVANVTLAIALTVRLSLGNVLLSHVPFPTYTMILIAAIPWSMVFSHHGESTSNVLLILAAALALSFTALPLARPIRLIDGSLAVVVPLADASLALLVGKAAQRNWDSSIPSFASTRPGAMRAFIIETVSSYAAFINNSCRTIAIICSMGAMMLLPTMLISGELQHIARNSYVINDPPFCWRMVAGIALQTSSLLCYTVIGLKASPLIMTSLQVPLCSVVVAVLYHTKLTPQDWINLSLCWTFCLFRALRSGDDMGPAYAKSNRACSAVARKVFLAMVFYAAIYMGSYTIEEYLAAGTVSLPTFGAVKSVDQTKANAPPIQSSDLSNTTRDDYLGPRLPPVTFANVDRIMETCKDDVDGTGVGDIVHCLSYLNSSEDEYFTTPQDTEDQGSKGKPTSILEKIKTGASHINVASTPSKERPLTTQGKCNGPVTPFHTYWTGPATWRFELFIKGYLYTQNLACSRLWIWLDSDIQPDALEKMLRHDALFQRFRALLDEDYVVLKKWSIPDRIPLPHDSKAIDSSNRFKPSTSDPSSSSEISVAEGAVQDASGQLWLVPDQMYKFVSTPTQVSDLVRFVVLHLHGGLYLDLDVLMLRDFRPLLLPNPASEHQEQPAWAEQWVERANNPGDYNTAVLSLAANSSLSSYLLLGGLRMGMNFHPKIIGRMLWKEGRNGDLTMLHNAFFDPLVTNLRRKGTDVCTVPCHKNFESSFMGVVDEPENEWSSYVEDEDVAASRNVDLRAKSEGPATNRTMEHFFRGAFAYHIHNQWWKFPERESWMDVITQAQDGFFAGERTNVYGEMWGGPALKEYDRSGWGWES